MSEIDNGDRGDEARGEPWPDVLSHWRTISAEAFDDATKAEIIAFVRATTSTVTEWRRAVSGDVEAAIDMVMRCKVPTSIGIKVDFPMTVLLSCAFDDPGAALVLSRKLLPNATRGAPAHSSWRRPGKSSTCCLPCADPDAVAAVAEASGDRSLRFGSPPEPFGLAAMRG